MNDVTIGMKNVARVHVRTADRLMIDRHKPDRTMGSFILIGPFTPGTVAAGMIITPQMSPEAD